MASKDKKGAAGPAGKGLKVVPKKDGFRRAGFVFSGEGQTIPYADLTEEQADLLRNEPMLVVAEVDIPKAEEAKS